MLTIARIGTALFALIALASGGRAVFGGLAVDGVEQQLDNDHRFFAAIWMAVGLGLAYCVPYLRDSTALFRFLMLALMAGGVGRALGWLSYPPDTRMIVAVAIELVLPLVLMMLQATTAGGAR